MTGIGQDQILEGGCLCGAIRYRLSGPTLFVSQCACRDCQKATGTGHTTIVGVHRSQLALDGVPAWQAGQATLRFSEFVQVNLDGEPHSGTAFRFDVLPRGDRVHSVLQQLADINLRTAVEVVRQQVDDAA